MHRILATLLAALILLPAAPALDDWDIPPPDAGFGAAVTYESSLVPVTITVENRKLSSDGRFVITSDANFTEVEEVIPFQTPAPSLKTFTYLTRPQQNKQFRIRYEFDEELAEPPKTFGGRVRDDTGIILAYEMDKWVWDKLNSNSEENDGLAIGEHYVFQAVQADDLVDMPLAYDGIEVVILNTRKIPDLRKEVLEALADWVDVGGVVIFQGPDRSADFLATLPIFGLDEMDLSRNAIMQKGAGWIAVDLAIGQVPLWANDRRKEEALAIFPRILVGRDDLIGGNEAPGAGLFTEITAKEGTYGVKGFFWLTVIILAYLAVIGPLDWWLVKKLGKPYLTWFFFVGAICVFSVIAYWYSSIVHSDTMQSVQVNILDTSVHGDLALGNTLYWLYSTKNFTYRLTTQKPGVYFSVRESASPTGIASTASVRNHGPDGAEIEAKLPIFSSKYIDATWIEPWTHQILVDTIDGNLQVTLPRELPARSIELCDSSGMRTLTRDAAGTWITTGSLKRWEDAFASGRDSLDLASQNRHGLPSRDRLDLMVRTISFLRINRRTTLLKPPKPENVRPPDPDDPAYPQQPSGVNANSWKERNLSDLLSYRDAREHGLNIRGRVDASGRVLLITLEDDANLMPLTLNSLPPQNLTVNVLRVQLP